MLVNILYVVFRLLRLLRADQFNPFEYHLNSLPNCTRCHVLRAASSALWGLTVLSVGQSREEHRPQSWHLFSSAVYCRCQDRDFVLNQRIEQETQDLTPSTQVRVPTTQS